MFIRNINAPFADNASGRRHQASGALSLRRAVNPPAGTRADSSKSASYGFRPIRPSSRLPIAEKPVPAQGFFDESVSGILKGSAGNRIS
jgi:hypothetical protein